MHNCIHVEKETILLSEYSILVCSEIYYQHKKHGKNLGRIISLKMTKHMEYETKDENNFSVWSHQCKK